MNIDELIEEIYWLNLQNLNGREDFEEAFMKGIEVAVTTLKEEQEQLIKKHPNDSDLGKKVRAQGKQAIEETDITYTHSATCENDTSCFEFYVLLDSDMNREKEYHWDNNLWLKYK
jgi:hypothetical protein